MVQGAPVRLAREMIDLCGAGAFHRTGAPLQLEDKQNQECISALQQVGGTEATENTTNGFRWIPASRIRGP
jgi:hypothetical protein